MTLHLHDLLDETALRAALADGFVRARRHPTLPLTIFNYTEKTAYSKAWTPVTLQCRGLVADDDGLVVARPWGTFFNHGEGDGVLPAGEPVEVTDKQDGSLGILYPTPDGWAVATRGSFDSEQARHATAVLRARYGGWTPAPGWTVLVEIVYPANRIVLSYDGLDDLVLLGAVETATGRTSGVAGVQAGPSPWPGPVTSTFPAATLAEALALPPRANAEGVVVRFVESDLLVKIKQADYVALHRLITGTSARSLWEHLAVDACRELVREPKHWGSQLGIGPDRAAEILAVGDAWREHMLSGVPDEFYAWVQATTAALTAEVDALVADAQQQVTRLSGVSDRRNAWESVRDSRLQKPIMDAWSGRPDDGALLRTAWRLVQPSGSDRPFSQSEDAG